MSFWLVEGMYRKGFCIVKSKYNNRCKHKLCFRYYKVTGPPIVDEEPHL